MSFRQMFFVHPCCFCVTGTSICMKIPLLMWHALISTRRQLAFLPFARIWSSACFRKLKFFTFNRTYSQIFFVATFGSTIDYKKSVLLQRASRQLKNSLEKLHRRLYQEEFNVIALRKSIDFMPLDIDYEIQRKKRMLEVSVQDAFLRCADMKHCFLRFYK